MSRKLCGYVCRACRRIARDQHRSASSFASVRALHIAPPRLSTYSRFIIAPGSSNKFLPRRSFAVDHADASRATPRDGSIARLIHRRLLSLSGPDAAKFLQGLVTNNVDANNTSSFYAAFLDARGRVLWDVFIYVRPERVHETGQWECYIEVDESEKEALLRHLKRHKLRSKVKIEDVPDVDVWASWGSQQPSLDPAHLVLQYQDPRAPHGQLYRCLLDHKAPIASDAGSQATIQDYHRMRYGHGIPEGPAEIARESALPMECNIDLSSGIDFKKGCYVGQELTIRTKHTGVVRKRVLPVQVDNLEPPENHFEFPPSGTDIKQLDDSGQIKKGRATGKFLAGIGNVGLALCRLEMMTSMKISAEGGSWRPGMEFGVETPRGILKLKPILHDWMVLRERNLWDKNRTRI